MVEVIDEHGEMAYPLAVAIEDLAISFLSLPSGQRAVLEVVAIADEFSLFPDKAGYRASGTPMAVASPIPSSLFASGVVEPEGSGAPGDFDEPHDPRCRAAEPCALRPSWRDTHN